MIENVKYNKNMDFAFPIKTKQMDVHCNEISFNISKEAMRCMFFGAWISLFIKMVKVQAYIALCKRLI